MGAARLLRTRWGVSLASIAVAGGGLSYHFLPGRRCLKNDSGQDTAAWKQNKDKPSSAPLSDSGKSNFELGNFLKDNRLSDAPSTEDSQPTTAWDSFTKKIKGAQDSFSSIEWAELIKGYVVPGWVSGLPDTLATLQRELSMGEGSLADEIWSDAHDADLNPEIVREARVRIGADLCREEQYFQWRRRQKIVKALASYLDIDERDVHPEDVPVIAMCSSGGGLRALVAGSGSYLASKEAGLWDCVTYTAGVSGTCWLQTLYYSSLGQQNFLTLADHLKERLGVHIAFPPDVMHLLTTAPTNKYLLKGLVEKLRGDPGADFGVVDIYGLLLSARLLVSVNAQDQKNDDLKLSGQRLSIDGGANPLPIYTAVRHEIPYSTKEDDSARESEITDEIREKAKQEAWFQWFEFTPYEVFCEELGAGIPAWALGRHFKDGNDVPLSNNYAVPELRVSTLLGIWGSAFCATLAHYYKEIRPALKGIVGFGGIDSLIEGKNEDLIRVHPFDPATVPNFVLGLEDKLPPSCPRSVFQESHLRLMDAGMSNNLPIYPLLRPGRDVDLIISFDASADIKEDNWLAVVDGYARQRGIKGWPIGAGWPQPSAKVSKTAKTLGEAEESTEAESSEKLSRAQELDEGPENDADLTYCNVWVGTTQERTSIEEPPPSKRLFHPSSKESTEFRFHLMRPDAGIAVAYFPLFSNPRAHVPKQGDRARQSPPTTADENTTSDNSDTDANSAPRADRLDPAKDDFMSTWNFVYTPEQVDAVVALAKANFAEGEDQVKKVIRAIYERKRKARLEKIWQGDKEGLHILV